MKSWWKAYENAQHGLLSRSGYVAQSRATLGKFRKCSVCLTSIGPACHYCNLSKCQENLLKILGYENGQSKTHLLGGGYQN